VTCREAKAPLLIVDIDKTLVASGIKSVLWGTPRVMPGSREAMQRLAKDFTVIYLTHRVDYMGEKTKAWLKAAGYPRGPVLLADVRELLERSGAYKNATLEELRHRFTGRAVGVGDKPSDAAAYTANGVQAFLLVDVPPDASPSDLSRLADSLQSLPEDVQVVTGWNQVEQALAGKASYTRPQVQVALRRHAEELKQRKKQAG
jgi:hypothetical protein